MRQHPILESVRNRPLLFDGALGTELMKRGLPQGTAPELWNVSHPEIVREIHASYFAAGSDAVSTNSFGGSPINLASHGLEERCRELNQGAVQCARDARPAGRFIAASLGPTGKFLKPQGRYSEEEFEKAFLIQAEALSAGGADLIIIETMFDLREAAAAVRAARQSSSLPVFVTMTFNKTPRGYFTIMGQNVAQCFKELETQGADAVGANCTLASGDMIGLARELRRNTSLPVIVQPNAGQPEASPSGEFIYRQPAAEFAGDIVTILAEGVDIIGGCCGTTPEHIRRIAALIRP